MTQPLFWLVLTTLFTTLMWMPYILNTFAIYGIKASIGEGLPNPAPIANWAERARKAHYNAIENLPSFAVLAILAHITDTPAAPVAAAAMVYFFIRVAHYFIYMMGTPYLRTLTFLIGWGAQLVMAYHILVHTI